MPLRTRLLGIAAGAALLMPMTASAVIITQTITFDSLTPGQIVGAGLTFGSFDYENVLGFGSNQRARSVSGGIAMTDFDINDANGAAAQLTLTAGGVFDVLSIDIADLSNNPAGGGGSGALSGSGYRIGFETNIGGSVASFTPTSSAFTTIDLSSAPDYSGVSVLYINIVGRQGDDYAIDNIVVRYDNGVPAPATALLAGAGMLLLGWRRRRG